MKYLLDTCVVSEINKEQGHTIVKEWIRLLPPHDVFISAITLGEIRYGITLLPQSRKRQNYECFLQELESQHGEHILNINSDIAKIWGELTAKARKNGHQVEMADGLIAATAKYHGLHVVTRNIKDFFPTEAMLINPWP